MPWPFSFYSTTTQATGAVLTKAGMFTTDAYQASSLG
jgi:hypothetical protein